MIFLLLYIVFSSIFTLCIKWVYVRNAESKTRSASEDIYSIGAINYIVACLCSIPLFLNGPASDISSGAVITGGTMGVVYFIAFFFVIYSVRVIGASTTTVVGVLSILMPIIVGAIVWAEQPNAFQIAGIALALIALLLVGASREKETDDGSKSLEDKAQNNASNEAIAGETKQPSAPGSSAKWLTPVVLITFFFLCGLSRISQDAFKHVSTEDQLPTFLFFAFILAAIPSIIMLIYRRKRILPMDYAIGITMGVSNILQTEFILQSLKEFPGFIVFPVTSAGAIIFTMLVATKLLGESLTSRTYVGIGIAVVSLILLNWT